VDDRTLVADGFSGVQAGTKRRVGGEGIALGRDDNRVSRPDRRHGKVGDDDVGPPLRRGDDAARERVKAKRFDRDAVPGLSDWSDQRVLSLAVGDRHPHYVGASPRNDQSGVLNRLAVRRADVAAKNMRRVAEATIAGDRFGRSKSEQCRATG